MILYDCICCEESVTGKEYFFYVFCPPNNDYEYFRLLSVLTKKFKGIESLQVFCDGGYSWLEEGRFKYAGSRLVGGNFLMHHACESSCIEDYPSLEFEGDY